MKGARPQWIKFLFLTVKMAIIPIWLSSGFNDKRILRDMSEQSGTWSGSDFRGRGSMQFFCGFLEPLKREKGKTDVSGLFIGALPYVRVYGRSEFLSALSLR
jgi:hypothetical protein